MIIDVVSAAATRFRTLWMVVVAWLLLVNTAWPPLAPANVAGFVESGVLDRYGTHVDLGAGFLEPTRHLLLDHSSVTVVACIAAPVLAMGTLGWERLDAFVWFCLLIATLAGEGRAAAFTYAAMCVIVAGGYLMAEHRQWHTLSMEAYQRLLAMTFALWPLWWGFMQVRKWHEASSAAFTRREMLASIESTELATGAVMIRQSERPIDTSLG